MISVYFIYYCEEMDKYIAVINRGEDLKSIEKDLINKEYIIIDIDYSKDYIYIHCDKEKELEK